MKIQAICGFVFLLLLSSCANSIEPKAAPAKPKPVAPKASVDTKTPVTKDEANKVFVKVEKMLVKLTQPKAKPFPTALKKGPSAMTRAEMILEMNRLMLFSKPTFKFAPKRIEFDAKRLVVSDPKAKEALKKLVAYGFVAPVGPLSTGPGAGLGPNEFGDAVGFFLARISELTHQPRPEWSPALQPSS